MRTENERRTKRESDSERAESREGREASCREALEGPGWLLTRTPDSSDWSKPIRACHITSLRCLCATRPPSNHSHSTRLFAASVTLRSDVCTCFFVPCCRVVLCRVCASVCCLCLLGSVVAWIADPRPVSLLSLLFLAVSLFSLVPSAPLFLSCLVRSVWCHVLFRPSFCYFHRLCSAPAPSFRGWQRLLIAVLVLVLVRVRVVVCSVVVVAVWWSLRCRPAGHR